MVDPDAIRIFQAPWPCSVKQVAPLGLTSFPGAYAPNPPFRHGKEELGDGLGPHSPFPSQGRELRGFRSKKPPQKERTRVETPTN